MNDNTSSDKPVTTDEKKIKIKSRYRKIICSISAVLLCGIFVLLGVLATDSGQRKVLALLDQWLDSLSIEQIEGGLQNGLELHNVQFHSDGVNISLAKARLQLDLTCLLKLNICLNDLTLHQPTIQIDSTKLDSSKPTASSNNKMAKVWLPVGVQVDRVQVQDLDLQLDQTQVRLANFTTAVHLNNHSGLTLLPTEIENLQLTLTSVPNKKILEKPTALKPTKAKSNAPIDWVKIEKQLARPLLDDLQTVELPLEIHIQGIKGKDWLYQQNDEKGIVQRITIPTVELQADATGYFVQLQKFDVQSSQGYLRAEGQVELQRDFPLQLSFLAALKEWRSGKERLLPASKLRLNASGNLKKQTALSFETQGVLNGKLSAKAQFNTPKTPFAIQLNIAKGQYPLIGEGEFKFNDVNLALKGDLFDYQVQLKGSASGTNIPQSTLNLQGFGKLTAAEIQSLNLTTSNGSANLNAKLNWHDGVEWNSTLSLDKLNVGAYLESLPAVLSGQLHSQGHMQWFRDKSPVLSASINGSQLSVIHKIDYRSFALGISQLTLAANLKNNNLALNSDIRLAEQGRINAILNLQDLAASRQLSGNLNIQDIKLSLANQLLKESETVNGDVIAALKFGGNLTQPTLNGSFNVRDIHARIRSLPFEINSGDLALNFTGRSSTLRGFIQTADSRLNWDGQANWQSLDDWRAQLRISADQFKVDIPSMAKLKISPNIEIKSSPKLLELGGEVDIPWARIEIDSLPDSAQEISKDEVLVDGNRRILKPKKNLKEIKAETASGMKIQSDLRIKIGDDVSFNAFGLKTNLKGLLALRQQDNILGLHGQVNLKRGRYASFGQDLLVRKGTITFAGDPSQPMISVEAIRNPETMEDTHITAGINVQGYADAPDVNIFTNPSMPQDQALSYLLTGRGLESDASAGGTVGAALLSMGLAKSGKIVGGIGEAFGIQDLSLGAQGSGNNSKVTISGNITPRLQVKYGVGLFDGLAEFTMRYRLMPRLYLQSVSGVAQAVDLLYRFEF